MSQPPDTSIRIEAGVVSEAACAMADAIKRFKNLNDKLDSGSGVDAKSHDAATKAMYKARNKFVRLFQAAGGQND